MGRGHRLVSDVWLPCSRRGLVIAMVASFIFIVLLRFLAGIMVWVMIVMVILVLGYGERGVGASPRFPRFPFPVLGGICVTGARAVAFQVPSTLSMGISGVERRLPAPRSPLFSGNTAIFCVSPQESSTVTWNTRN